MDIMYKTYDLIDVLDNSDIVNNIKKYKELIINNKEVQDLLERSKSCDEYELLDIKRRLYNIEEYKNYMDSYNELFYIVMDINYKLNKLISDRKCLN